MKIKLDGLIKNKYALIVLAVGLVILLWPTGSAKGAEPPAAAATDITAPVFSLEAEEERLANQLGLIRGVGKVSVLLAVEGSASRELAESGDETLVISENGAQKVVELLFINPVYVGAVIVCEGGGNSTVKLEVTKAVTAITGLGSDKIQVIEMA